MDLKQLQTFLVLSEIRNFTKAADRLHYAQSNVTAQIQQLEKELGVRLFERLGKRITLTGTGQELIPYARKMLNLSRDIGEHFSSHENGRIVIGASESICIYRLPAMIKAFQASYPAVEIYLSVLDTPDFVELLADNTIDLAYVLDTGMTQPKIEVVKKIDEPIGVYCTPEHPLAQKPTVSISDFSNQKLILTGKDCCYRKQLERDLSAHSVNPKIVLQTSSIQVIKQAALSGLGICVLPQIAVQRELDRNELVRIHYDTDYKIQSQLLHHKDKWLSPNLESFLALAKEFD